MEDQGHGQGAQKWVPMKLETQSIFQSYVDTTWLWQVDKWLHVTCHHSDRWPGPNHGSGTGTRGPRGPKWGFRPPLERYEAYQGWTLGVVSGGQWALGPWLFLMRARAGPGALAGKITSKMGFLFITPDSKGLWTWDLDSHLADPRGYQTPRGRWACPPARPPKTQKTVLKANQR